ncbi:MAG: response regulator [Tannerella sp.]|jgi:ligand-binding sensor domain-containing protein/signal transduction histidine kinase/DNA-binding response OmpR family regulator|nr:response regulator [Tannerella sp.]
MKYLLTYSFLFLLCFPLSVQGEESYYFRHFGVENGLPQNTVSCIFQDKQGFMWFGTKDGLSRYDGYEFRNFRHDKKDKNSIGNNFIRSIFQGESEDIWVGTDVGVYIYHPSSETFSRFDLQTINGISIEKEVNDIKSDKEGNLWFAVDWQGVFFYKIQQKELIFYKVNTIVNAWCICIDRENNVWIGTHGDGLNCYDRKKDCFETISPVKGKRIDDIYRLFQDNYNDLLIGSANGGVRKLSLITGEVTPLLESITAHPLFVRDIIRKSDNELCIGTESGIYIYNTQNRTIKNLCHENFDPYSLSDNAVYSLYKDREGGLWIGTYFGGVNYYPPQHTPFERFYPQNTKNTIHGKRIREFQQDRYGNLWIGTEDGGLNQYNPLTKTFRNFVPDGAPGSISYHNIHGLFADEDKLWVGTFTHGVNVIDLKTQKIIRRYEKTEDPNSICDNSVFSIYKDNAGNLWFATIYGLALYNPQKDNFTKIEYTGDTFIYDIFQSYDGLLWFASFNQGLFRYNPRKEEWKIFQHDPENEKSLGHDKIISIYEDSKKTLWFTTEGGGICQYNEEEESFTSYTTKEGLPNDVVYKILEDDKGRLWFTSNNGLSCFDRENNRIKTFTLDNGLLGDQFNYKSGYKTPDGKLYFGCLNGFIAFDPLTFTENDYIPPVVITGFRLFNKEAEIERKNAALNDTLNEIHLKYNQSSFVIDFAALSYTAPEKNEYAYMLEGFEEEWIRLTGKHSVTYSNVPPGDYLFCLKGSNNDGKWNELSTTLVIHIHPPFYKTNWAYAVYILFLLFFIVRFIISYNKRLERRNRRRLEIFENEKDKELYNAKITFFTNIAHEIRTPLSLIKGPVEHILTHETDEEEMKENLKVVERNTNRLLDLSNQLLDFRKVEANGFQLNYMHSDIKQVINDVYIRFQLTARQKNLAFELQLPSNNLFADIDREAFTKIISNLFTNALKYANTKIGLVLESVDEKTFRVKVSNDGYLIPEELKEKIFEPFFQIGDENGNSIKSGAGLGLPLARSLAELHKGKLYLEILPGQLNVFILQLPFIQESAITLQKENTVQETDVVPEEASVFKTKPTLLVVEDDKEMRYFLYNKLRLLYHVVKASNGKQALEWLQKENVDIVITDIMMPEMDGLQLCAEIKSNIDSSHIPVIMLTAKADIKSRIEGLEAGADAYVEKPFSMEHLLVQISNIFTNRNKVKQAFINSPAQNVGSIALTKADEIFLEKAIQIIHKNLSDTSFNVDLLADELFMSRSSLRRKIKGISELAPNDFIQLVRLKKAAELLQEGSYRINEICFLVGFNSSSYFSKCFKKQFGIPPKESRTKN